MCQWDVVHGRNRYIKQNPILAAGNTLSLRADSRRIGLLIGGETNATTQRATIFAGQTTGAAGANFIGSITYGHPFQLYDIETFGTMVTGAFVITNNDMLTVAVTEILSVDADTEQSVIRN